MFNRLRALELLKERGRTREWVAKQCRVAPDTFTKYLLGNYNPSAPVVALMAQAFEVPEQDLYEQSEGKQPLTA